MSEQPTYATGGYITHDGGQIPEHLLGDPGFIIPWAWLSKYTYLLDEINQTAEPDENGADT